MRSAPLYVAILLIHWNNTSIIPYFVLPVGGLLISTARHLDKDASTTVHDPWHLLSHLVLWVLAVQAQRMHHYVWCITS